MGSEERLRFFSLGFYGHDGVSYDGMNAADVIKRLDLQPLPEEGGFFNRILESKEAAVIPEEDSARYGGGGRLTYSLINYLMTSDQFSALHALKSDESWTFIAGSPLELRIINPHTGEESRVRLDAENRNHVVPRDSIFGAYPLEKSSDFSLITCEVRPGFEFSDFVLVSARDVLSKFPALLETVRLLTRREEVHLSSTSVVISCGEKKEAKTEGLAPS